MQSVSNRFEIAQFRNASKLFLRVDVCANYLPEKKPRYVMGVGYPEDLVVSVALGADMFDCVWPSRTAVRKCCDSSDQQSNSVFNKADHDLITAFWKCNHIQGNYQPAPRFHCKRLLPHRTRLQLHLLSQARRWRPWHNQSIYLSRSWKGNCRSSPVSGLSYLLPFCSVSLSLSPSLIFIALAPFSTKFVLHCSYNNSCTLRQTESRCTTSTSSSRS